MDGHACTQSSIHWSESYREDALFFLLHWDCGVDESAPPQEPLLSSSGETHAQIISDLFDRTSPNLQNTRKRIGSFLSSLIWSKIRHAIFKTV